MDIFRESAPPFDETRQPFDRIAETTANGHAVPVSNKHIVFENSKNRVWDVRTIFNTNPKTERG